MNAIDHTDFVPCDFAAWQMRAVQVCASGLRPLPAASSILANREGEQPSAKTIRIVYDPTNFQHLSLIVRLFSRAFVNHTRDGDVSGLATVIKALPQMTFAHPELLISLQFTSDEAEKELPDRATAVDLHWFLDAAPGGLQITWLETLLWRRDAEGKISERWQAPAQVQEYNVAC